MKRIYFDYNATTPTHPKVVEAMLPFLKGTFGNASSVHAFGREARYAVEVAREVIAKSIGAEGEEIIFTSGGTESNNLAMKGSVYANREKGDHIITSQIEHSSVLRVSQELERDNLRVTYLPVDKDGLINPEEVKKAITDQTILITTMHANNEVGTIEPISEIGKIAKENDIYFHTDAIQSIGKIPVNVNDLGVNLLAASGHKIAGPKGIGFLYKRIGTEIVPQIHGGSHERNLRAGTENVPLIVGLGKACEILQNEMAQKMDRVKTLRNLFEEKLKNKVENIQVMGHLENRLPNTSGICFSGIDGSSLMRNLDLAGIAVSTGSACTSGAVQASHVLQAMGIPDELIQGAVRFSFGEENTKDEVLKAVTCLVKIVDRLKA